MEPNLMHQEEHHDICTPVSKAKSTSNSSLGLIIDFPQVRRASSQKENRRVSFANEAELEYVEYLGSRCNKGDIWYTGQDMKSFKSAVQLQMRTMMSSKTSFQQSEINDEDTSFILGLERYRNLNTARMIQYRQKEICKVVLLEQHLQYHAGIVDPDRIADIAMQVSEVSRKRAHIIGLLHVDEEAPGSLSEDKKE